MTVIDQKASHSAYNDSRFESDPIVTLFFRRIQQGHFLLVGKDTGQDKTQRFWPGFNLFLSNILQNLYFSRCSLWRFVQKYLGAVATRAPPKRGYGSGKK